MAKIVVGSPSLTQSLLLYPGLGPAMLGNRGLVVGWLLVAFKLKMSSPFSIEFLLLKLDLFLPRIFDI
jgi:hypothetical protein